MADETKRFIIETIYNSQGLKTYTADIETARAVSKKFGIDLSSSAQILEQSTTKSFKTVGDQTLALTRTTALLQDQGKQTKIVYEKLGDQTRAVSASFVDFKSGTAQLSNEFRNLAIRAALVIPTWLLLRSVFTGVLSLIKDSLQFMIEWEYQMAQIRIVSNNSSREIESLSHALLTLSRDLGISNKDIGEAAKLYVQQGLAIKDVIPLMNATAKLSMLTGRTMTQSVEDLTAVLKAYRMESTDAINVVDALTNVELVHAVTTADLAEALKQVASTAATTGVSLSSLIGFITAIKSETRDTGNRVGLSLRTMFARITTASAEAIQTLTGVPFYLDQTGKATTTVTPVMRNLDAILAELSISFKSLTDAQKLQLSQLIGGTHRLNQASALFNNFNESVQAQADALFSLGRADKAVGVLTDTMQLRIKKLSGAWDEFVATVADTSTMKSATGFLTEIIRGASSSINPNEAYRTNALESLTKSQEQSARQQGFADALIEVQKQASQLAEIMERNPKAIDDARIRTAIWAEQINKVGKDFGIAIDKSVTTPTELVDSITQQLGQVRNLRVSGSLDTIKSDIKKEMVNAAADIRKIIEANFEGQGITGRGSLKINGNRMFDGLITLGLSDELKNARKMFIDFEKETFLTPEQGGELKNTFKDLLNPKDFADFSSLVDDLVKTQESLNNVESRRSKLLDDQIKKEEESKSITQSRMLTEDQLNEKLRQIEREGIINGTDRLDIVNQELTLLKSQGDQLANTLDTRMENLETEKIQLEVTKKRADLESRQAIALNDLKNHGATNLQILIQELAFLTKIGAKEDEIRKKRQEVAIEQQNVATTAQQTLIDAQVEALKTQGLGDAEIIKGRIELEKRLGVERKGVDALKEQLELLQAVNKERAKTPQQRLQDLSTAIKNKRKESDVSGFGGITFDMQAASMSQQARFAGLSDEEINRILRPASDIQVDLPNAIKELSQDNNSLGENIDKLALAIESLVQSVVQDESRPLDVTGYSLTVPSPSTTKAVPNNALSSLPPISRGQTFGSGNNVMVQLQIGDTQVYLNKDSDRASITQMVTEQLDIQNEQRKTQIVNEIARQLRTPGTELHKADKANFNDF